MNPDDSTADQDDRTKGSWPPLSKNCPHGIPVDSCRDCRSRGSEQ